MLAWICRRLFWNGTHLVTVIKNYINFYYLFLPTSLLVKKINKKPSSKSFLILSRLTLSIKLISSNQSWLVLEFMPKGVTVLKKACEDFIYLLMTLIYHMQPWDDFYGCKLKSNLLVRLEYIAHINILHKFTTYYLYTLKSENVICIVNFYSLKIFYEPFWIHWYNHFLWLLEINVKIQKIIT